MMPMMTMKKTLSDCIAFKWPKCKSAKKGDVKNDISVHHDGISVHHDGIIFDCQE